MVFTEKPKKEFPHHGKNSISCVLLHSLLTGHHAVTFASPSVFVSMAPRITYVAYQPNHVNPLLKTLPHAPISPAVKGKALSRGQKAPHTPASAPLTLHSNHTGFFTGSHLSYITALLTYTSQTVRFTLGRSRVPISSHPTLSALGIFKGLSLWICLFWTLHVINTWSLVMGFLHTLGGSLLRAFSCLPSARPFHPPQICRAHFLTSFRSSIQVSGEPSLSTLFLTATPSQQHCLSPSLLYFLHSPYHHTNIRLIYPVSRSSSRPAFCSFINYYISSTYTRAWQHSGNSLNIC